MGTIFAEKALPRAGFDARTYIRRALHKTELFPRRLLRSYLQHSTYSPSTKVVSGVMNLTNDQLQMYETEARRRIRNEPAVAFDLPQRIWFPAATDTSGDDQALDTDHVANSWSF